MGEETPSGAGGELKGPAVLKGTGKGTKTRAIFRKPSSAVLKKPAALKRPSVCIVSTPVEAAHDLALDLSSMQMIISMNNERSE